MVLTKLTRDLFWQAVGLLADKKRDGDGKTSLKPGQVGRSGRQGTPRASEIPFGVVRQS